MTESARADRAQRNFALGAFLTHWALALFVQLEGVWLYANRPLHSLQDWLDLAAAQGQNILAALALGLLALLGATRPWSRVPVIVVATLVNLYVALNALSIKLFAGHFRLSLTEGPLQGGEALWDSIRYELDWAIYSNLAFAAAATVLLAFLAHACRGAAFPRFTLAEPFARFALVIAAVGLAISAASSSRESPFANLREHPLVTLWSDKLTTGTPLSPPAADAPADLSYWQALLPPQPDDGDKLLQRLGSLQSAAPKLNLVLIVLESVGSLQLFPRDGGADPHITPNIARLQSSAVLFDSLYSPFPGTVRSHVALSTGGNTLTWGSVFHELGYPYVGPTINRSMSESGLGTALFSSQQLRFENMDGFYRNLGWGRFYEFGELAEVEQKRYRLNSWGGEEFNTLDRIFRWIEEQDHAHPFFVQYLTVATHHPYTAPEGYPGPATGDDRLPRYHNALHYTDLAIGKLVERLQRLGLADSTLIAITGDHGQAFAERHPGNLTHKNFLYEENIKNFLFLYHPAWRDAGLISRRVGTLGDILPTLRGVFGLPAIDVPGRDLFGASFEHRPAFFYKNAYPEKWGLRLGNWKYISTRDNQETELYDLASDPTEQHNLAPQHHVQLVALQAAIQRWYLQTNDRFVAQLKDYHYIGGRGFTAADLGEYGPKIVSVGHTEETAEGERFVEHDQINPQENFVVWTKWLGYPQDKVITYRFVGPAGPAHQFDFTVKEEWSTTRVEYDGPQMAEGSWRVELWDGDKKLIEKAFSVSNGARLFVPLGAKIDALESAIGFYSDPSKPQAEHFFRADALRQIQLPAVWTRWRKFPENKALVYHWRSPSGEINRTIFQARKGWDQTWVNYEGRLPLEPGQWQLTVTEEGSQTALFEIPFTVLPSH